MRQHPIQAIAPEGFNRFFIEDPTRCTGRSTAIAFDTLASIYRRPGKWIKVVDHHDTDMANRHLFNMICHIIERMEYKAFERRVDSSGCYIRLHYEK
jgi:hypothetical protein